MARTQLARQTDLDALKTEVDNITTSATVPEATATKVGGVVLTGDFGGTAESPTVPGLTSKINNTDARLTDARTPTAHATSHSPSGTDDISGVYATKVYASSISQGLSIKDHSRAASTANVDITVGGLLSIDGVALNDGDRVLLKNQADGTENGIYTASSGSWARASDADTSGEVTTGMFTFVIEGTTQASSGWVITTPAPITLDTTSLTFSQFSAAGQINAGNGLVKSGSTLSADFGIVANKVAQGNDGRFTDQRTPVDGSVTDAKIASGGLSETSLSASVQTKLNTLSTLGTGTDEWLRANFNAVAFPSVTRDGNDAAISGSVVWPDLVTGVYTATGLDPVNPVLVNAYKITYAKSVSDGQTFSNSRLVSNTYGFSSADVGKAVAGTGIPGGTVIAGLTSAVEVTLSAPTTATASGVTFTVTKTVTQPSVTRDANGFVVAQPTPVIS